MTISRKQFDKGLDDTEFKILKLLQENPDKAFEANEVATAINNLPKTVDYATAFLVLASMLEISLMLDSLVQRRFVDKKIIKGKIYYSIHGKSKTGENMNTARVLTK